MNIKELLAVNPKSIDKRNGFSNWEKKKILLYGAGNVGKSLYSCLKKENIDVIGFIDKNAVNIRINNISIYELNDVELNSVKDEAIVILAGLFGLEQEKNIRENLINAGFKKIYGLHEIDWQSFNSKEVYSKIFIGNYDIEKNLAKDFDKIEQVYGYWNTSKEKEFYLRYLKAYLECDMSLFNEPLETKLQYLDINIEKDIDYSRFIDCGAFNGDTLKNFVDNNKTVKEYIALEPQGNLCNMIKNYIDKNLLLEKYSILPCGVSDCFKKVKFLVSSDGKSAAKVDNNGNDIIQCLPIDAIASIIKPTFIKMDIEGMEIEALKGAENTIKKYKPNLAVCIYHDLSHLWEVPLLIKKYYSGYSLYIRNYQFMGLETVVYAFPDK